MSCCVGRGMSRACFIAVALVWMCVGIMWAGCGQEKNAPATNQLGPESDPSVPPQGTDGDNFPDVFVSVARRVAPMPVFGCRSLPPDMDVADYWWPVVDVNRPEDYQGPQVANPRIQHEQTEQPEAQIVFQWDDGWVVVLENFRGDVGITAGETVGLVAGQEATLYEINGGLLVQWEYEGRWYGLFARGVDEEDLVDLAQEMEKINY